MVAETTKPKVRSLEYMEEFKTLKKGDWVNTIISREGFNGKICFIGDYLDYGPSFAREIGEEIRVYIGLCLTEFKNKKMVVKNMCAIDYPRKSIEYTIVNRTLKISEQ